MTTIRRRGSGVLAALCAAAALCTVALAPAATSSPSTHQPASTQATAHHGNDDRVLVFGHRGASGYRPEHTLASYELAARMGADYIEPDLVATRDGQLVARHENEISGTTDVASRREFAARKTTKSIDGVPLTGWFTEDFTLAELRTLRAIERIPALRPQNTLYDGRYQVPTFQEVLSLRERLSRELRREIGVAPEIKHPTYFQRIGLAMERPVVDALRRFRLDRESSPAVVQSFEVANLRELSRITRVRLVQLTSATGAPYDFVVAGDPRTYADLVTPAGLREIARYADVLGPEKAQIVPRDAAGFLRPPTTLVADAHRARLDVVPYTFRNENNFLPADFRSSANPAAYGDAFAEYEVFLRLGVDGIFSDNPDTAVEALRACACTRVS